MSKLTFYPTLNNNLKEMMGHSISVSSITVADQDNIMELNIRGVGDICFIEDDHWNKTTGDLTINLEVNIKDTGPLFLPGGIAEKNDTLGFSVKVYSPRNMQSRDYELFDFKYGCKDYVSSYSIQIMEEEYLKDIIIMPFIYLKDKHLPIENAILDNSIGTHYGFLNHINVNIYDTNSIFNIVSISDGKDGNLWTLKMNWENPEEDSFYDSNQLCLNIDHKYYEFLDVTNKRSYNEALMNEIMLSTMEIIIRRFISFELMDSDADLVLYYDTTSNVVNYWIDVFNIHLDDNFELSTIIRKQVKL